MNDRIERDRLRQEAVRRARESPARRPKKDRRTEYCVVILAAAVIFAIGAFVFGATR